MRLYHVYGTWDHYLGDEVEPKYFFSHARALHYRKELEKHEFAFDEVRMDEVETEDEP